MGSVGKSSSSNGHMSYNTFMLESQRQGGRVTPETLEDYTAASYGATAMGDTISDFIDNVSDANKYGAGNVYRGLTFNSQQELDAFLNAHPVGSVIQTRRDGISWTSDRSVAEEFSTNASDYAVILVNSDSYKNAIGIENVMDTPIPSHEVLYSNKVNFKVIGATRQGDTIMLHVTASK